MALAVANRGTLLIGILSNVRHAAPSSLFGPASVAATRHLYTIRSAPSRRNYYVLAASPSIGGDLVLYNPHHQLLAHHFFSPMFFTPHFFHPVLFTFTPPPPTPPSRWWVWKQGEDAVEIEVALPGLPAERVKVSANKKGLFIKVEGVKCPDGGGGVQDPDPYSCHIELSAKEFDLHKAKAEMKHGLLKLTVPWVKKVE